MHFMKQVKIEFENSTSFDHWQQVFGFALWRPCLLVPENVRRELQADHSTRLTLKDQFTCALLFAKFTLSVVANYLYFL